MSDQFQVSERITRFALGLRGISTIAGGRQFLYSGLREPRENTEYPGTVWDGISTVSSRHNGVDFIRVYSVLLGTDTNDIYGGGRFLTPLPARPSGWVWWIDYPAARIIGDDIVVVGLQRQSGVNTLYVVGYHRPFGVYGFSDDGPYDPEDSPDGWREFARDVVDLPWSYADARIGMWRGLTYLCHQQVLLISASERSADYRALELAVSIVEEPAESEPKYLVDVTVARTWALDAEHTIERENARTTPLDSRLGPSYVENSYAGPPDATGQYLWTDSGSRDESGVRGELLDVYYDGEGAVQGVILQSSFSRFAEYSRQRTHDFVPDPGTGFGQWSGGNFEIAASRGSQSAMTLHVGENLTIPWGAYTETLSPWSDSGALTYAPGSKNMFTFGYSADVALHMATTYTRRQLQHVDWRKGVMLYLEFQQDWTWSDIRNGTYSSDGTSTGGVTTDKDKTVTVKVYWGLYRNFQEVVPRTLISEDTRNDDESFTPGLSAANSSDLLVFNINVNEYYGVQPGVTTDISVIPWTYFDTETFPEYSTLHPGSYAVDDFRWNPVWNADTDGRGNLLYSLKLTNRLHDDNEKLVNHNIGYFGGELFDPADYLPDDVELSNVAFNVQFFYIHAFSR